MKLFDLKQIEIGDWVTSSQIKGYFKVMDIKKTYRDQKEEGYILILKKGFTSQIKFSCGSDFSHVFWCSKVQSNVLNIINDFFSCHEKEKQKFDNYIVNIKPAITTWFLNCNEEKVNFFIKEFKNFQSKFTYNQFIKFATKIDLKKYMRNDYIHCNYLLRIFSYSWEIDENKNILFFNPLCEVIKN